MKKAFLLCAFALFAAAVFADQADAAAGGEGEGGLFEQHFQAALQGEVFDFYHV